MSEPRVLHGPGVRGIVPGIVHQGAPSWLRQPLAAASDTPPREDGGVDLWLARLDEHDPAEFAPTLDSADAARADAVRDALARRRAVVSRGLLRRLLAPRLGVPANEITFEVGAHGKPVVAATAAGAGPGASAVACHFNLSHSGGWWLLAVAGSSVGVDLEVAGRAVDAARLARRVFTPGEQAALRLAGDDAAATAAVFLDCWTRKEALLKALGTGFAGGAADFHVGPGPGDTIVRAPDASAPGRQSGSLRVRSVALPIAAHAAIACAPSVSRFGRVWLQGPAP
jgi:4'-phosphopantetheinyl transferase